ncbi:MULTISPECIES: AfsR/SARP family transcriptional regulator [Actinokineospora]|uniref:AfsR/SARP family transcriptional regulator n=1 Tax=Actinokineospora TaxID=39845 RepID=UPI002164CB1C|nr:MULTISPECIES: AfsR/SARP family transcriptional regulator [Actinokineospora]
MPSAAKPRTVLALLAVHANTVVPVDAMVAELWGKDRPRSAKTVIQTYIMHLRKLVDSLLPGGVGKQIVATRPGGYMLDAEGTSLDMRHFDQSAAAGHRAREAGELTEASQHFAEALSWWQGRPLLDIQLGETLTYQVKRLEEAWLNVLDRKIEVDLRLGRHHELLGELTAMVARHPTHEGLCAHLMLALYRSGRRPEALDVYRQLHTRMVEQQALEPSPALRRLHRSMLVSDRGSADLTDLWQGAAVQGRPSVPAARSGAISPELAAIPWNAHPEERSPSSAGAWRS